MENCLQCRMELIEGRGMVEEGRISAGQAGCKGKRQGRVS